MLGFFFVSNTDFILLPFEKLILKRKSKNWIWIGVFVKIDEANMNESDENKSNSGHKSNDYLGNCVFVISNETIKLSSIHCFMAAI